MDKNAKETDGNLVIKGEVTFSLSSFIDLDAGTTGKGVVKGVIKGTGYSTTLDVSITMDALTMMLNYDWDVNEPFEYHIKHNLHILMDWIKERSRNPLHGELFISNYGICGFNGEMRTAVGTQSLVSYCNPN